MSEALAQRKFIIELAPLKLVGLRVLCPGDQYVIEIPKASLQLSKRMHEISNVVDPSVQLGAFVVENDRDDEDGYWICVEVEEFGTIPSGMVTLTIPSQTYAVIRHQGPNRLIRNSYENLHQWIDENQHTRLKNNWHVEKFYDWSNPDQVDVELFDTIDAPN